MYTCSTFHYRHVGIHIHVYMILYMYMYMYTCIYMYVFFLWYSICTHVYTQLLCRYCVNLQMFVCVGRNDLVMVSCAGNYSIWLLCHSQVYQKACCVTSNLVIMSIIIIMYMYTTLFAV